MRDLGLSVEKIDELYQDHKLGKDVVKEDDMQFVQKAAVDFKEGKYDDLLKKKEEERRNRAPQNRVEANQL